jgi:hypothetical protein
MIIAKLEKEVSIKKPIKFVKASGENQSYPDIRRMKKYVLLTEVA